MKALVWHGKSDIRFDTVADPKIQQPTDIILRVTATAICGSDLHIFNGLLPRPAMKTGDVLGHEFMGEVVELGKEVHKLKKGDRVVVPFAIACGMCHYCERDEFAFCENTNPDRQKLIKLHGHAGAGMFGYSHLYGGYWGGQAEYVRVPHADVGPIKVPEGLNDEQVLFLSDIFPTGWMAAENAQIRKGDTVAIWGCGPVGQMAIRSAWMQGASRVIAIDHVAERLNMARKAGEAETIDFSEVDVYDQIQSMTRGRGAECCIDCVGAEAHGWGSFDAVLDRVKHAVMLTTDRLHALREAIWCCGKGGRVSIPGVYFGFVDKLPFGAAFGKGLTLRMGQTHVQRYLKMLMERIEQGEIDPSFVITHRLKLSDGPQAYKSFRDHEDGCIKVVMTP